MTFGPPEASGRVIAARDIDPVTVPGHAFRILTDGSGTGGAFSLTEAESPKGAMVGCHAHDETVECFYVLDGRYRLTVSGDTHELCAGGFLLVPRGAPHRFEVTEGPARALVLFAPAGFEEVFRRMPEIFGTPGEPGPLWEHVNSQARTRLLGSTGPGPAALVRAGTRAGSGPPGAPLTLADSTATRTSLRILLRDGDSAGATWTPGPSATAVYVLAGRYRFDLPEAGPTVGEGEYLALTPTPDARAVALTDGGRTLVLELGT
ncbi:cupin domain-containing protein [Streptomyces sp. NPDC058371]|uniref:cupin domain-containing protein n=1 Tax=Streptomyces sp. NPDC058371 TaxID=3346463 RepID=UPI003647D5F0